MNNYEKIMWMLLQVRQNITKRRNTLTCCRNTIYSITNIHKTDNCIDVISYEVAELYILVEQLHLHYVHMYHDMTTEPRMKQTQ